MGLNHTPESKVMTVWICRELSCSISSVSIYYVAESDIRVKSYDHLYYSRASVVQFWASIYIMGLNHTLESKVNIIWICIKLSCSLLIVSIYYAPESDIRVKSNDHLNYSRASVVQFRESRYIMGLIHTTESKVKDIWICQELSCSISIVSIYYAPESDIWVKSFDHLYYSRASIVQFLASRYLMHLNRTSEWKFMII